MRIKLFAFQEKALKSIHVKTVEAINSYKRTGTPQVISFTAPTGSGKTIVMSALIEDIYYGTEDFLEQPDAILLWLSDSPQLNEQSKLKIDMKADKIRLEQCVVVNDDSFDSEVFQDGHVYFLNTQKLSKSSNLTKNGDNRTYTIWETIANTVAKKSDHLYFIIDEAHRGMKGGTKEREATTIMQKFLKGSKDDNIPPMPVVIGMSATTERFNKLVEGTVSTIQKVVITPEEVRDSGLLKDKIIITYPELRANNDIAILQAAAENWKEKCEHWNNYCNSMNVEQVNPVFVIQVLNGTAGRITDTSLSDIIKTIEESTGMRFSLGEVVHTFGQTNSSVEAGGVEIQYVEPSRIIDDENIKVVFFKENLSTGWDCPRAETMMSFKHASDSTYIAQLLGRMVRTPKQMHIDEDDTLNDVHLYLPYFNEDTVKDVIKALQSEEGPTLPTEVCEESLEDPSYEVLTVRPVKSEEPSVPRKPRPLPKGENELDGWNEAIAGHKDIESIDTSSLSLTDNFSEENTSSNATSNDKEETKKPDSLATPNHEAVSDVSDIKTPATSMENVTEKCTCDREEIMRFINESGLLTYVIRTSHNSNYLKSLFALVHLLEKTGLDRTAADAVKTDIGTMIHEYIEKLKAEGKYNDLVLKVKQFKLASKIFDTFGETYDDNIITEMFATDVDIERQFQAAESKFKEGIGYFYGNMYNAEYESLTFRIDFILYVADEDCMTKLYSYAKSKFHELNDKYRRQFAQRKAKKFLKEYEEIVSDGDDISEHNFRIPETITIRSDKTGKEYSNHLFLNEKSGVVRLKLNSWEEGVIQEEEKQSDFLCWLRNPTNAHWALCIPYRINNQIKAMYPDFIIIRKDMSEDSSYIIDILEPHSPALTDNLNKAKGFAEYARKNLGVGRIQLIREVNGPEGKRFKRLDMSRGEIRDKVLAANTNEELNHIFDTDGFFII